MDEIKKRDQILSQLHREQATHNADTIAFLEVVNAIDFKIMDKAEVKVNDALH